MNAKRRVDYSRLVTLDLSPTEAAIIAGVLGAVLKLNIEDPTEREIIQGTFERLRFELKALAWPADPARKAPFPV